MKVAIMYSGGKDSNYAVKFAQDKGWDIAYLLSIKPSRTDCFLFHYATVEHTPKQAESMGLKHYLWGCDVADPKKEAEIVKGFVLTHEKVDALLLGGTGLQATQIRSLQEALMPEGIEVFAAHSGLDHFEVMKGMLNDGFEIMITQVASEGLPSWLGKTITKENLPQLEHDANKYGFHVGGEGGYFDSFVVNAPHFKHRVAVSNVKKNMEDQYCGHITMDTKLVSKVEVSQ